MTHVPVLVVGGGPTGVTAATLLAQYGVETLVLDRWSSVYPQPRAVHLDDEVYRILGRLGIADEFAAISRPALGLRLVTRGNRVLTEFRRSSALSVNGFPQANMFDQPDLEALLRRNLKRYPAAQLRGNSEVTGITEDGARLRVTYTDRVDGSEHVVTADYVLGCDGANSLVANHIGVCMTDLRFDQRWLVIDVETAADLAQWEGVHQVCDPGRAATYMRIGETRYRWEFRLLPGESAADFGTLDSVRPLIAPWIGTIGDCELELLRVAEYTFRARIAKTWHSGNVFLLGDAAHLTPPFIGQGLGAGVRDAMNLAWKLAGVIRGDLPAAALDSYQIERRPHAAKVVALALGVGTAMTAGGEAGNLLRRVIAPRLPSIPGLRAKVVDGRTPALSRSVFVRRGRRGRGLAGTLCPNPLLSNGFRLDTVLGNGFALITTTHADSAEIARRGAVVHVAEPGDPLDAWLRSGHARAAIVRPDRTVMCVGSDAAALIGDLPSFGVEKRTETV